MKRFILSLLCIASGLSAADVGTIAGRITNGNWEQKAKIHILRDGYSGAPVGYQAVAGVVITQHFLFGAAIVKPIPGPGYYQVSTDKHGHFSHAGLPVGTYTVTVEINGQFLQQAIGVAVSPKGKTDLEFDLARRELPIDNQPR